jgi:hypothetical protein
VKIAEADLADEPHRLSRHHRPVRLARKLPLVKSRPWTAGERLWNSWRPGDRDVPEPVIFTGARGGRGREWKRSEPAGVGGSQPAQAARLSTLIDSGWLST